MRSGRAAPAPIVDLKRIPELTGIACDAAGGLRIGAATPCAALGEHAALRAAWPGVVEAADLIGSHADPGPRQLGGNLCNASPAADTVPALIAAGARCRDRGPGGDARGAGRGSSARRRAAPRWRRANSWSALAPAAPAPRTRRDAYLRFIPRTEMDIAVVGAARQPDAGCRRRRAPRRASRSARWRRRALLVPDGGRRAGRHHARRRGAARRLRGRAARPRRPINDKRGTAEYRRQRGGRARRAARCRERHASAPRGEGTMHEQDPRISATVNGEPVEFLCEPRADAARRAARRPGLTGTKEGCSNGDCGACTCCSTAAGQLLPGAGAPRPRAARSTTIEGIATGDELHPLQQQFLEHAALQCGFCTPGFIVAAKALLDQQPEPDRERGPLLAGRQPVPLHRLRQDRPRGAGRRPREMRRRRRHDAMNDDMPSEPNCAVVGTARSARRRRQGHRPRAATAPTSRLPGMLYGKVLRSPHAHARILRIDTTAARGAAGREGRRHRRRFPRTPAAMVDRRRGRGRRCATSRANMHGARQGALSRPRGGGGRRDHRPTSPRRRWR